MQIWIDADACPKAVKEILFRAANRTQITVILVANKALRAPHSVHIKTIKVAGGFDAADDYICQQLRNDDLIITADIPLAAAAIAKGAQALNPRGEFYTTDNIREHLAMRNLLDDLRGSGVNTGGPASLKQGDLHAFANQLDRFLTKFVRN